MSTTLNYTLSDAHFDMLQASGITREHAELRGYRTITEVTDLQILNIAEDAWRLPGLLVPQLRRNGSVWGHQYRPDSPRLKDGRMAKYEAPAGQRGGMDVPPDVGPMLDNPHIPLWVTEGVKKADAGALAGLCIVALPGVWNWRGTNEHGGKMAIGEWHDVALNGRRVILAFDGDVARKKLVHDAMRELAKYLRTKGAKIEYAHLPDTDAKTGLDDFLVEHDMTALWERVHSEPPPLTRDGSDDHSADPTLKSRLIDGASFILEQPDGIPAIWGDDSSVLWAEGEALMICGVPGVGKTTLAIQTVLGLLGIGSGMSLGLPVKPVGKVLYLAMDRPRQIARAFARVVTEEHRGALSERLAIWQGPPLADMAKCSNVLVDLAKSADADVVIVDSLKDAALGLAEDAVGAGYNRARQAAVAEGIEVCELHHTRKDGVGSLADVYGSTWLTSGAGSVVILKGEPGNSYVNLVHLKQPADTVGPLRLFHDQSTGRIGIEGGTDLLSIVRAAGISGVTAKDAAAKVHQTSPDRNQVEQVRRQLKSLTNSGAIKSNPGARGGAAETWLVA